METKVVQRRYELDWLRVAAIFTVFIYHGSMVFGLDPFQVKNAVLYPFLDDLGALVGLWGMPLIFIVSGASIYHALGKHTPGRYILGMLARLVLPLVVCMFTHSAFQVYIEHLHKGTFSGSFIDFYPHYFEGLYGFGGNFAWMGMHLWYLEALFIFSILCLPLFVWLRKHPGGQGVLRTLGSMAGKPAAIYLLALPAWVMINLFDPDGLGTTVLGGWSIFNYLAFFISGFVLISNMRLQTSFMRMRFVSLVGGILLWGLVDPVWEALGNPTFGTWQFAVGTIVWCLCAWCWLLAVLGLGFRYLNRSTPFLGYGNEAVLPFYILHQTVLLPVAFFVVQWAVPDLLKFLLILCITFAVVMALYELLVRRINILRFLFGMKPVPRITPVQSQDVRAVETAHSM